MTPAVLDLSARRRLLAACGLLTLAWAMGGMLSLERTMFRGRSARILQGVVLGVLYGGLIALRLPVPEPEPPWIDLATDVEGPDPGRRVILLAIDGLSPDLVLPLVAEGKLPTFGRMMREGAWARVDPFVPAIQPVVWTSVATGVLPRQHGVLDFVRFQAPGGTTWFAQSPRYIFFHRLAGLGLFRQRPVESGDRREPALWNILTEFGLSVGVVDWWATTPAEPVRGAVWPPAAGGPAEPSAATIDAWLARLADWGADPEPQARELREVARTALVRDFRALGRAAAVQEEVGPAALMVYLPGLDAVQHRFLGYGFGSSAWSGGGRPHPVYGEVVSRYYRFLDESIAATLEAPRAVPTLFLVVSGFGVDRVPPWSLAIRGWLGAPGEGYHDRAPSGAWFAWGDGIVAGAHVGPARPQDVLPTALYYLGLPVARDLDGRPRTDLFTEEFTEAQPLAYFPSFHAVRPGGRRR